MDNQPIQPPPPPPSSTNYSKPFLLILGAIALMVISGVGGYFLGVKQNQTVNQYPQASPTAAYTISPTTTSASLAIPTVDPSIAANWKTYTSKVYKFEFKYPPTYVFESENLSTVTFSGTFIYQKVPGVLDLNFNQTINAGTLKNCGEDPVVGEYICMTDPTKEEIINNIKFRKIYLIKGFGDSMGTAFYVVQTVDGSELEFVLRILGGGYQSDIDQILSTFRFIE